MHVSQLPLLVQPWQPVLLPLLLQQLPPRQTREEHDHASEQVPPSGAFDTTRVAVAVVAVAVVVARTQLPELKVYPDVHSSQLPLLSQLVHADGLHFVPAHRPSLQTPDAQVVSEAHPPPSDFFA
jgi:hypothetical protein